MHTARQITRSTVGLFFATLLACGGDPPPTDASLLLALARAGSGSGATSSCPTTWPFASGAYFADQVAEAPSGALDKLGNSDLRGQAFKNPAMATDGVCGGGWNLGSTDVYSLAAGSSPTYCKANEKCLVLSWSGGSVLNVAGMDFVVYENPFEIRLSPVQNLVESVIVEVSRDGATWCGFFNPKYNGSDLSNPNLQKPDNYVNLAGITPVLFNQATWTGTADNLFTSTGPGSYGLSYLKGGGDGFDLDYLATSASPNCDASDVASLQTGGFRYVRLTAGNDRGFVYTTNSFDKTPDIDGVVARSVGP